MKTPKTNKEIMDMTKTLISDLLERQRVVGYQAGKEVGEKVGYKKGFKEGAETQFRGVAQSHQKDGDNPAPKPLQ